jgi:hypothetical protein
VFSKLQCGKTLCRGGQGYRAERCLDDGVSHAD